MAPEAIRALERALRRGDEGTRPGEDADALARAARRHGIGPAELLAAAADIRDTSRRPVGELAKTVWGVLGDPGAEILELAAHLLAGENSGSTAAV